VGEASKQHNAPAWLSLVDELDRRTAELGRYEWLAKQRIRADLDTNAVDYVWQDRAGKLTENAPPPGCRWRSAHFSWRESCATWFLNGRSISVYGIQIAQREAPAAVVETPAPVEAIKHSGGAPREFDPEPAIEWLRNSIAVHGDTTHEALITRLRNGYFKEHPPAPSPTWLRDNVVRVVAPRPKRGGKN
jgi:hypothetical protein